MSVAHSCMFDEGLDYFRQVLVKHLAAGSSFQNLDGPLLPPAGLE